MHGQKFIDSTMNTRQNKRRLLTFWIFARLTQLKRKSTLKSNNICGMPSQWKKIPFHRWLHFKQIYSNVAFQLYKDEIFRYGGILFHFLSLLNLCILLKYMMLMCIFTLQWECSSWHRIVSILQMQPPQCNLYLHLCFCCNKV